jgi:hypothetical protein
VKLPGDCNAVDAVIAAAFREEVDDRTVREHRSAIERFGTMLAASVVPA